jgi:hypothetical protein
MSNVHYLPPVTWNLDVYDLPVGSTVFRGPAGWEGFDIDRRSLGIFPDRQQAFEAISRAASESGRSWRSPRPADNNT